MFVGVCEKIGYQQLRFSTLSLSANYQSLPSTELILSEISSSLCQMPAMPLWPVDSSSLRRCPRFNVQSHVKMVWVLQHVIKHTTELVEQTIATLSIASWILYMLTSLSLLCFSKNVVYLWYSRVLMHFMVKFCMCLWYFLTFILCFLCLAPFVQFKVITHMFSHFLLFWLHFLCMGSVKFTLSYGVEEVFSLIKTTKVVVVKL